MKRTAFAGLFISAALLASPVFADSQTDLCQINLQKIDDLSTKQTSESMKTEIHATVGQAKAEQSKGTKEGTEKCISLTTQALQTLENNTKGDQQ
ncbi:hypothetical protein [Pseudomonas fluorescens]|uniref:Secreted protein n=1 Tax=Pseudomonas fluorescens TaxID=294 RepID=A0A944DZW4_PSEFL|nr:hypothetical protein [Pseudomonas fluorescens]MBT2311892.1 hypothetical protein [Pseudomonas fluorescens]MBT2316843.1 hypothetical protein [Pseudomonas fluorescens]MBT2329976.1 hypothetical protein [Pseudomonas fluorescens]MBT2344662.1 hypothetical protein [Pseudomonas fluorescens]MBT2347948.1 hypothetical protein [Pseudomonas fluorescens]